MSRLGIYEVIPEMLDYAQKLVLERPRKRNRFLLFRRSAYELTKREILREYSPNELSQIWNGLPHNITNQFQRIVETAKHIPAVIGEVRVPGRKRKRGPRQDSFAVQISLNVPRHLENSYQQTIMITDPIIRRLEENAENAIFDEYTTLNTR
ncbi:999_t:CDS:1 [Paraglomus brasilianum]|uniref:999_t:CDS:1 n=1 Tax=Paraglomus brasilianum TaxID=144538 RepID=A0A9N8VJR6_9GLOM|nr:999_t:CDS:1 [Paraglomus brasilianum]